MKDAGLTRDARKRSNRLMRTLVILALAGFGGTTGGCVNVTAPDKPIQINLNISVTQEVVYRLDNDAKTAIQQNPGIF